MKLSGLQYVFSTSKAYSALNFCTNLQDNAKTMKVQLDAQTKAVDQLKGNARMLENKLADAKSKKDTLKARAKSANSSKQINEMLAGLNTGSATAAFDRMEEKVMSLESESEAAMQVTHHVATSASSCTLPCWFTHKMHETGCCGFLLCNYLLGASGPKMPNCMPMSA